MKEQDNLRHIRNGWLYFDSSFLSPESSGSYMERLKSQLAWQSSEIKLFGKSFQIPRLEAFYAEKDVRYSYSGKQLFRNDFTPLLKEIRQQVENRAEQTFNAVLANWYRNGSDSNGWHADNEKELGLNPVIASVSFGQTRRFDLKHNLSGEKLSIELTSGSLLIMGGEIQHFWKHQVPKQKKLVGERINLTFRHLQS